MNNRPDPTAEWSEPMNRIAARIFGRDCRRELAAGRLTPDTEARIYDLARRGARHAGRVLDNPATQEPTE